MELVLIDQKEIKKILDLFENELSYLSQDQSKRQDCFKLLHIEEVGSDFLYVDNIILNLFSKYNIKYKKIHGNKKINENNLDKIWNAIENEYKILIYNNNSNKLIQYVECYNIKHLTEELLISKEYDKYTIINLNNLNKEYKIIL